MAVKADTQLLSDGFAKMCISYSLDKIITWGLLFWTSPLIHLLTVLYLTELTIT